MSADFVIARNAEPGSTLPYLLRVPLGDGIVLKAKDTWPRTGQVYSAGDDPTRAVHRRGLRTRRRRRLQATVERESLADLVTSLTTGKLRVQLTELSAIPRAAVVAEEGYSRVFKLDRVRPSVVADGIAECQTRFPTVPIVSARSGNWPRTGRTGS
jgi:hypothetical protein